MRSKYHEPWCSGPRGREFADGSTCAVANCSHDKRYRAAKCECSWRGRHCSDRFFSHKFQGRWIHAGTHLICRVCGHEGT